MSLRYLSSFFIISCLFSFVASAQKYCYIMDDANTHPTLGYYVTPMGTASATLACPNNSGVVTQGYTTTSQMFKPADKCYAIDPWTYMRSQGHAGTYRNCKAGPYCGYLINPIAIVNCSLDRMTLSFLIFMSIIGFFLIKRKLKLSISH